MALTTKVHKYDGHSEVRQCARDEQGEGTLSDERKNKQV